ncbi:MAG: phosphatidate cytidylyltransferase [Planctomycetes bacterium]|nr:phosphatidate cytidylyltransferase [Planctomycetota bacterium]
MAQRVLYGTLFLVVFVTLCMLDALIATQAVQVLAPLGGLLQHGSVVPLVFLVVFVVGAVELNHLFRLRSARPYPVFACVMVGLLLMSPWLSSAGLMGGAGPKVEGLYWQMIWMIVSVAGVGVIPIVRRNPDGALRDGAATLTIISYLGFLASFGLQIRCGHDMPRLSGVWLFCLVVLVTKASDIGAYLVGSTLGRHKLLPVVSPSKSVEGAIGGLVASAGTSVFLVLECIHLFSPSLENGGSPGEMLGLQATALSLRRSSTATTVVMAAIFGFLLSLVGQLGDLVESSFKRDACVKDSGKILARFGGILDLVDSPVLAMPAGWFYLTTVWGIG